MPETEARARRWLARHGAAGREVTPLLRARLAARRRGEVAIWVVIVLGIVPYVGWSLGDTLTDGEPSTAGATDVVRLAALFAFYAIGAIVAQWIQARDERRVGAVLRRRVADPVVARPLAVVGAWFAVAALVVYAGGLLVGAVLVIAGRGGDRSVAAVFLGAVLVFAVLGLWATAAVVRRPVVAEDGQSLWDDRLLRREEAMQAITPYSAVLAAVAGVNAHSDLAMFALVGYGLAALAAWLLANAAASMAKAPEAARPVA